MIHCRYDFGQFLPSEVFTTVMHRYGPNDTYPCVFNMKRITYPYLLADFYDASQFEIINSPM